MTLGDMLSGLFNRLNLGPKPSVSTQDRLLRYLNETLEELVSEPGMSQWVLQHSQTLTVTSVANQDTYACPRALTRLDAVCDRTTTLKLEMMPVEEWRRRAPNPALFTGTPSHWVPRGIQALANPLSAASGLWVVSSDNGDTTPKVFIDAVTVDGQAVVTNPLGIALQGVTRVAIWTPATLVGVTRFLLDLPCAGSVSLYDAAAGGNLLATIAPDDTVSRYVGFSLYPTPTAALTYYFDGELAPPSLTQFSDEPPLPAQFHRLLTDGALWREYDTIDDDRAAVARKKYEHGVSQWRYYATCPPDYLPARSGQGRERSRLGGMYPDGAGIR